MTLGDESFIVLSLYISSGDGVQIYVLERELVALARWTK